MLPIWKEELKNSYIQIRYLAIDLFVYRLFIKIKWNKELRRNYRAYEDLLQKYDSEAGYHLTRMNESTNRKYQDKLNTTKLKPFKWGWEDNGED